jgi:arginine decarboxylase
MYDLNQLRLLTWDKLISSIANNENLIAIEIIEELNLVERFWSFPGSESLHKLLYYLNKNQNVLASNLAANIFEKLQLPNERSFKPYGSNLEKLDSLKYQTDLHSLKYSKKNLSKKPCFEVLIFHPDPKKYFNLYQNELRNLHSDRDEFFYDILFVSNLSDAVVALCSNSNIQAVVSLSGCLKISDYHLSNDWTDKLIKTFNLEKKCAESDSALFLREVAQIIRPEIENVYISESDFSLLPRVYFSQFNRVLYYLSPFKDIHHYVMNSLRKRYNTPFFNALMAYSQKPKTVFHALPISQGSSIRSSLWTKDFYEFYGKNIFDAETSSTQRGLDSLLNPKGAIKNAQDHAAETFGSAQSYFVTNGTSTANKIVIQANLAPGDIVFISTDCHKSIPYGLILSGASVLFLQTNPIETFDLYGAISLNLIIEKMLFLKEQNLLDKLKVIILTNSTFDGLLYDVENYMLKILAIKPDIIFFWDEAWFAHAHFHPMYRKRHAMSVVQILKKRFTSEEYFLEYEAAKDKSSLPDPHTVTLRVYVTQSTHKTLSSFRQGAMIHIYDELFNSQLFLDAFYTHTSTSPNYQILASLDIARRQMAIEGMELLNNSLRLAFDFKNKIRKNKNISKFFKVLEVEDLYSSEEKHKKEEASEFEILDRIIDFQSTGMKVDPTRITLDITKTGLSGGQFRKLLINKYNIQVNKTSRNTVLFILNIGATKNSVDYLYKTLEELSDQLLFSNLEEIEKNLKEKNYPLPQMRQYHSRYLLDCGNQKISEIANIRLAYYDAYNLDRIEYILVNQFSIDLAKQGQTWVSANFVTPYPPGFPILVPGQIINHNILIYISSILNDEIHGFQKELGLRVFKCNSFEEKK